MHIRTAAVIAFVAATGCRLDPLVDDTPGASGHVLAAGSTVPSAADSPEIANQIALNDGIDDRLLVMNGNVILRGTGASGGQEVHYWSFGSASPAPAPLYRFFRDESGLDEIDHPPMVESLPGERTYNPLHSINRVIVTDRYRGELITSADALADAIELGLVEAPRPTGEFVVSPIVLPSVQLEVGMKPAVMPAPAQPAYAHGYAVGMFVIRNPHRLMFGLLPTRQVSFLRESNKPAYDVNRPIFEATTASEGYTPLSVVINVDLVPLTAATSITRDSDLFNRGDDGAIVSTTNKVQQLQITTSMRVLPIQVEEGAP